jgi:hypothetical protein
VTDRLQKRIDEVEDQHAEEVVQEHLAHHRDRAFREALHLSGGFKVAAKLVKVIDTELMRGLERFQEEKRHEALGYQRFVEFLDQSEYSPMSKAQYYERRALLEKEGDQVFNFFNDLGVSIRKRKLLGKGNVEIEGENVIIRDGEEETSIAMTDRSRLLETLSALADANADKSAKLEKQKEKIDRHGEKVRELYDDLDRERARQLSELGQDPHSMALANLCFAFASVRDEAAKLPALDRDARRDNVLEVAANQMNLLRAAYGTRSGSANGDSSEPVLVGDTVDEMLENFLDGVDLSGGNDAELAAKL